MRRIAWATAVVTAVAALGYSLVSLARWEWTRALYFGLVFLSAEVAIATALVLRRVGTGAPPTSPRDDRVRSRIRASRPPRPSRFDWLQPMTGRMNVFITFLVGGGLLLSGVAWLADRIAGRTITPGAEAGLARRLGAVAYPRDGLVADDIAVLAVDVPGYDDPQLRRLLRRAAR